MFGGIMRKHHIALALLTTIVAAVAFTSISFTSISHRTGDAVGPGEHVINVHVADKCGNLVRESDGEPMVIQVRLDPPPLDDAVAADDPTVELLPPTEETQYGVYLPADPRKIATANISC
jgi:hypothetical protein